jgi:hypothetical protein
MIVKDKLRLLVFMLLLSAGYMQLSTSAMASTTVAEGGGAQLSQQQVEDIVRRSYPYVAMYNVNNKFALSQGGWNTIRADTALKDHTLKEIARPNNDTLYISAMLDLRKDPVILDIPAFDSKYVSLMVTGYDHYVNVPMSVTKGDFKNPEKVLFYTSRTQGYDGREVAGVDRYYEMTGDFVSAVFRVMPHANDAALFDKIRKQMQSVKLITLSEFQGKPLRNINDVQFPGVGITDSDVYENNFLEVMQFVVNHTSFDANNELDNALLAALQPLGVEPGKTFAAASVAAIDGKRFRAAADKLRQQNFALTQDPKFGAKYGLSLFQPKGKMELQLLTLQSVIGPIGLPATEAVYPPIVTVDGSPMNAQNDYVIRLSKAGLPPARAFWSLTLYDSANGFFIPNDHKKYSVGENAGMKLNADGGIDVYISAKKPEGVPAENWLPINRKDENLDVILRIYDPDIEKFKRYTLPKAEVLTRQ